MTVILEAWPPGLWRGVHVVVAVSGGADSVALLRALGVAKRQAGGPGRLFVAHFNHGLRGEESAADARWVARLAEQLGIEAILGQASGQDLSAEEDARAARYRFLLHAAERIGARFVATGHTADDQAETILHRVLRGASLQGVAGIPFSRPLSKLSQVVRPLLSVSRAEVMEYLQVLNQDYRTDSTNKESIYTRNRLRLGLLPLLREQFGDCVDDSLRRLGQHAAEAHAVIRSLAEEIQERSIVRSVAGDCLTITPKQLTGHAPLVVREACKLAWREANWPEQAMGAQEWARLYDFLTQEGQPPAINLPGGVETRRQGDRIVLRRAGGARKIEAD